MNYKVKTNKETLDVKGRDVYDAVDAIGDELIKPDTLLEEVTLDDNYEIEISGRKIGKGHPTYIIGEIGLNHNGNISIALDLIKVAKEAGCDAVKFQKRYPDVCVPEEQKGVMRDTPWGRMTYLDYRWHVEFAAQEYGVIDDLCKEIEIDWFASPWDKESVDFLEQFNPPCYKIASAAVTDHELLKHIASKERPVILSTGMSDMPMIKDAAGHFKEKVILHATSTYPAPLEELNLEGIRTLQKEFDCPIGYSGHEVGLMTTYAAAVMGASVVERHITLDRSMWGSDHSASIEPEGLKRLVRYIREFEKARGDGVIKIYDSERPIIKKLRCK